MSFESFIGKRYLRSKQKHAFISLITLLSVAGVTVGVMALIVVIAVMSGAEADLKSKILSVVSHVVVMKHGGAFSDYKNTIENIEKTDGVNAATPFVYTQVMLKSSSNAAGSILRGVDPDNFGKVSKILSDLQLKKLSNIDSKIPQITLGKELAKTLQVDEGDSLYIISPRGMLSPIGHVPSMRRFQVVGVFKSGMYEYDGTLAYIHIKEAQKMLHMDNAVTGIEVRIKDIYKAKEISDRILSNLGFTYWAKDWMEMNQNLFSALKLEKTVMFIILTLIILVAAFNIASMLIMMVMEKTKDIAILKAMGATDKSIYKIFVFKGMAIGSLGTILGLVLGLILCILLKQYQFIDLPGDVYPFSKLPVKIEILDISSIAISAMFICFLATLYPARRASKLNPVEAIRYG
ncbi:MAG: lipoprotein-releasing ABC transporter permease subunit [Desulfobacterales bacterium]|nr:lipoprotein-releasing ABC transporter permease subunit [Desulfobacterales bacterium]MBF0398542.1 lipoprotein-releasing ABC transporter permease subunit [Desulfobacterales bacterium]